MGEGARETRIGFFSNRRRILGHCAVERGRARCLMKELSCGNVENHRDPSGGKVFSDTEREREKEEERRRGGKAAE